METIAASGRVGGRREAAIGAQVPGVVSDLYVEEGSVVARGQALARVRNEVASAQVQQAQRAMEAARASLALASAGARSSETEAAFARVRQASAGVDERVAHLRRAQAAVREAEAVVRERLGRSEQAAIAIRQAEPRRELSRKSLERQRALYERGFVARQAVDAAEAEWAVAAADVEAARQEVAVSRTGIEAARVSARAALEDVTAAQATVAAARASVAAAEADLRTVLAGPRREAVTLARERVREAEAALRTARKQAESSLVRAPFAGTVTQIIAERGAPVGGGILRLVQTGAPEVRLDVDEGNLADLRLGQRALMTSSSFRQSRISGRVREIGARVDDARGTVEVTVVPENPPQWLRPGQTVDVNIVVAEEARRLIVPASALRAKGESSSSSGRRVVLVVESGRAREREVVVGQINGDAASILEGLNGSEQVVRDAEVIQPGARVRAAPDARRARIARHR